MSDTSKKQNGNASRKPRAFSLSTSDNSKPVEQAKKPTTKQKTRKPRAISAGHKIKMQPDDAVNNAVAIESLSQIPLLTAPTTQKTFSWFKVALWAFTTLFALGVGLYVDGLIRELFARHEWLGIAASAITAIFIIAIVAMVMREIWSVMRMRSIAKLRQAGEDASQNNDLKQARIVAQDVIALLDNRPETAKGRTLVAQHMQTVMDGSDLVHLIERDLLAPLDKSAQKMVMTSAKRISVVTAVSPRAIVDIGFVLYENTRLIRAICEHYGGKPSTLGFWRLAKKVISHLAATGAIAVGDSVLQQFIGHGVASKLSTRLGEGVVNGLLCARIGIAAIDICRPLAFDVEKRPGVSDFLSALTKINPDKA